LIANIIILIVLTVPLLVSFFMKMPIFNFAPGSTDSWISFWGSYIGALIGALVVYLVTSMQVREQRNIQLDSIREEHNIALSREMQQFHFKNQIDKIEEFYSLLDSFLDALVKCSNDYTKYITFSHILYGGQDEYSEEEEKYFRDEIKKIKIDFYDWIHYFTTTNLKLIRLSLYVEDTKPYVDSINTEINICISELKSGYKDKLSFKKHLGNFDEQLMVRSAEEIKNIIIVLIVNELEPKLKEKINQMKINTPL
jgi:hypothetical protein